MHRSVRQLLLEKEFADRRMHPLKRIFIAVAIALWKFTAALFVAALVMFFLVLTLSSMY